MNFALPASLRKSVLVKSVAALGLLALAPVLTGCGPENGEQILPYIHNASLGGGGQLIATPNADLRHHQHTTHLVRTHRHAFRP